jgi:hypothetical protein
VAQPRAMFRARPRKRAAVANRVARIAIRGV